MSLRRVGMALAQRGALLLLAGIAVIFLLHVQVGVVLPPRLGDPPPPGGGVVVIPKDAKTTWSTEKWIAASTTYIKNLSQGDLGVLRALRVTGYAQDQPVSKVIRENLPRSLYLLGTALVLSLVVGTLFGMWGSRFGSRWARPAILTSTLALMSTPDILFIVLLRKLVIWGMNTFDIKLMSVATLGQMDAADVIAPALALSALPIAMIARIATVAFDDAYDQFYIRTAKSKGLHQFWVVWKHAFKNAWIRVAESGPIIAGGLVTGLVVVEYAFYFPGLGRTLGLILERGGQPVASASIALVLLVGALLLDTVFGVIRTLLDPRLSSREESLPSDGQRMRLADLLRSVAQVPRELWESLKEIPYGLRKAAWAWRPSYFLKGLWRNPPLLIGLLGILTLIGLALFGGHLADLRTVQRTPKYVVVGDKVYFPAFPPGIPGYPLGSDLGGRDLLARLLVGARYTLFFTLAVTPVRFLVALPWGLIAGFRRRLWAGVSRTFGLMLSAVPVILVPAALLPLRELAGADSGSNASFWLISGVLAVVGIPRLVETIRLQVEATLVQPFVEGARAAGAGGARLLFRHVVPQLMPQLWVAAAADMAWTLLLLAQLGVFSIFLGGSAQILADGGGFQNIPRLPDWSSMLAKPYEVLYKAPWSLWVPALAFTLAIIFFNLAAEGLRRRAQEQTAAPAIPDAVIQADSSAKVPAPARRRLALEWTAATLVLVLAVGVSAKYSGATAPVVQQQQKTPLERATESLQIALGITHGAGDSLEKSKAAATLPNVVATYLREAGKAGKNATQMQQDANGVPNMFSFDNGLKVMHIQVPDVPMGSFLFFINPQAPGTAPQISTAQTNEKPTYMAALEAGMRSFVVMAGTVPGPDNWVISAWERDEDTGRWVRAGKINEQIYSSIPKEYNAKLIETMVSRSQSIELTGGPLNSARVSREGDVEVCLSSKGPCTTIKWKGNGY